MQRVRLAAFLSCTGLHLVILPFLLGGTPLHQRDRYWPPHWQDDTESAQWLELLQPFTDVKDLYLSKEIALRIAPALRRLVGNEVTEMLPTLQHIFLEGLQSSDPVLETIRPFVAARRLVGHSIVVSYWDRE